MSYEQHPEPDLWLESLRTILRDHRLTLDDVRVVRGAHYRTVICAACRKVIGSAEGECPGCKGDPEDMEALAAAEHESWSGWAKYMLERQERELREDLGNGVAKAFLELESTKRWQRQLSTPYAELSEKEKESDRIEVRKKLEVYRCS